MTTDVEKACGLLDDLLAPRGVRENKASMLTRAHETLSGKDGYDWVPAEVRKRWKDRQRRIRALFDAEARRVDNWEIEDLEKVIEARRLHAERKQDRAERLAALRQPHNSASLG